MNRYWITAFLCLHEVAAFLPSLVSAPSSRRFSTAADSGWQGEIVQGGKIRGCSVQAVGEEPITEWVLTIDGIEADLGRFSEAIYKKILSDAKKQRFQGFRPGTIPPHLEPTYRTFTMDECARETVLEAMEQNSIRPFSTARSDLVIEQVRIPKPKMTTKKKKGGKKESDQDPIEATNEENAESKWLLFDNMKGAIDAGWKPGQSFSFVSKNVRGQKVLTRQSTDTARPLGLNY